MADKVNQKGYIGPSIQEVSCGEETSEHEEECTLPSCRELGILEPSARIKALADSGNAFEVDVNIPPRMYYRSGLEMVRMANVYMQEGNLENAYILYMKFMTLFLEKIRKHPDFKSVSTLDRAQNETKLKEVLPKAEKLKVVLLKKYEKEYKIFLEDKAKEQLVEKKKLEGKDPVNNSPCVGSETKNSRDLKDGGNKSLLLNPTAHNRFSLRHIIVPSKLMSKFLVLSVRNTEQNKETCGILAGVLQQNQLVITHLLIPKQYGSPDSCSTEKEEELFSYQDEHDLITLGWIHTHPTQTAFLSSIDLHTHCSYQLMMPEAIAIVCSPKSDENCFFTLTPEYGLNYISKCRLTGFHPHPLEPPLYRKAEHVKLEDVPVQVVDLRQRWQRGATVQQSTVKPRAGDVPTSNQQPWACSLSEVMALVTLPRVTGRPGRKGNPEFMANALSTVPRLDPSDTVYGPLITETDGVKFVRFY